MSVKIFKVGEKASADINKYPNVSKNGFGKYENCCVFCAGDLFERAMPQDEKDLGIAMWLDRIQISARVNPEDCSEIYFIKIYYCPMCGKRLLEQEEHHAWANDNEA